MALMTPGKAAEGQSRSYMHQPCGRQAARMDGASRQG